MRRSWILVALITGCAACTSVPIRYYTLTPAQPTQLNPSEAAGIAIDVLPVRLPAPLNRSELLVRTSTTQMVILDNEHWASALSEEIRQAVRIGIERRADLIALHDFTQLSLSIDIHWMEAQVDRYAQLEASWTQTLSRGASDDRVASCTLRVRDQIRGGYVGMVEAYQHEIQMLAEAVVLETAGNAPVPGIICERK